MEDPTTLIKCPDCYGVGTKIIYDWDNMEEYPIKCELCLGSGFISESNWGYNEKDKQESFNEDLNSDL